MTTRDHARPRTTMYDRVQSYVLTVIYHDYNWSCMLDARRNPGYARLRTVAYGRARSSTVVDNRARSSAVMRDGARPYTTVYDHARWCMVVHGYARQVEIHLTVLVVLLFLSNTNLHIEDTFRVDFMNFITQLLLVNPL